MIIESLNNSKVKAWNKLKEKKFRDEENLFSFNLFQAFTLLLLSDSIIIL